MKQKFIKRFPKKDKEQLILMSLVEQFIQTGKPIGSLSLKEKDFPSISSATIRNYFNKLEQKGFLKQPHASGGRLPTGKAFRDYANAALEKSSSSFDKEEKLFEKSLKKETKEISAYLQEAAELLSNTLQCSVFLSSPRFDQDFIHDIKLLFLDPQKILCVLLTDFGLVRTEILYSPKNLEESQVLLMEQFFLWKLGKREKFHIKEKALLQLFCHFYNELLMRHVVSHSQLSFEDFYTTGLSKLLTYPEFKDPTTLANTLALFENPSQMKSLLKECTKINRITSWIGEELGDFPPLESTVLAIPYSIHKLPVGALATLSPLRIPYKKFFQTLQVFSKLISETLTQSVYKFKISFHEPFSSPYESSPKSFKKDPSILLENQSKKYC